MHQRLVHQQDGVVDHDADQDDEAEHGQHVEALRHVHVEDGQPPDPAGGRQRHRQQDNQRIDEAFKQYRHDQKHDDQGNQQLALHGVPGDVELVRRSRQAHAYAAWQAFCLKRFHDICAQHVKRNLERDIIVRRHQQRDGAQAFLVADLGRPGRHFHTGQRRDRYNQTLRRHHRKIGNALGLFGATGLALQRQVNAVIADGHLGNA